MASPTGQKTLANDDVLGMMRPLTKSQLETLELSALYAAGPTKPALSLVNLHTPTRKP